MDEHAERGHHGGMVMPEMAMDLTQFDGVLSAARNAGIDASKLEIRPAKTRDRAWTVTEIDRSWPTQVDAVAVDPHTMQVLDRTRFEDFPLMAKLTRWGVDFHMGILFGPSAAAGCVRPRPVRAHYLGIPDVVDASSGAIGCESGTDALPELACLVSVGKALRC
jgi:uncharacterized iron-regulated membrane protein